MVSLLFVFAPFQFFPIQQNTKQNSFLKTQMGSCDSPAQNLFWTPSGTENKKNAFLAKGQRACVICLFSTLTLLHSPFPTIVESLCLRVQLLKDDQIFHDSGLFAHAYFLFLECSCSLHTGSFASFFRSQFEGYQPQEAYGSSKLRSFTCSCVIPLPSPTCY